MFCSLPWAYHSCVLHSFFSTSVLPCSTPRRLTFLAYIERRPLTLWLLTGCSLWGTLVEFRGQRRIVLFPTSCFLSPFELALPLYELYSERYLFCYRSGSGKHHLLLSFMFPLLLSLGTGLQSLYPYLNFTCPCVTHPLLDTPQSPTLTVLSAFFQTSPLQALEYQGRENTKIMHCKLTRPWSPGLRDPVGCNFHEFTRINHYSFLKTHMKFIFSLWTC